MARMELVVTARGLDDRLGWLMLRRVVSPLSRRTHMKPQALARGVVVLGAAAELLVATGSGIMSPVQGATAIRVCIVAVLIALVAARIVQASLAMERALSLRKGDGELVPSEAVGLAVSITRWRERTWLFWAAPFLLVSVVLSDGGPAFTVLALAGVFLFTKMRRDARPFMAGRDRRCRNGREGRCHTLPVE